VSWEELAAVLRIAVESDRAVGMEVTIYNPKLDPDGAGGRGLTTTLVEALGG
jgi:arginase